MQPPFRTENTEFTEVIHYSLPFSVFPVYPYGCRKHGLIFTAYCPHARDRRFSDPVLTEIANNKDRTIAQVAMRRLMQRNVAAIPRPPIPSALPKT